MGSPNDTFDFIIVGGGTAGCLLTYRLANAPSKPSILLLEAGTENRESELRIPRERYATVFTSGLDRGYVTTPQKALNGREIQYFRGQGLGGSSCVNFMQYSRGSSADYDEWARIVEDDAWKWESTKERFKRIEHHHDPTPKEWKKYAHSNPEDHGFDGPVDVSLPRVWERELSTTLEAVEEAGYPMNPDHNSGNVIGWAASVSSTDGKYRTTSASSTMYKNRPKNITVRTKQVVTKVIIQNGVAVGVLLADGSKVYALKDVILSAGPFDTPKLLLLSGIGPTTELSTHSIPTTHHLPGVGKNLKDHYGVFLVTQQARSFSNRAAIDQDTTSRAPRTSWETDTTGYYGDANSCVSIAYLRSPTLLSTPEIQDLDLATRKFLVNPKIPHYEHLPGVPPIFPGFDPDAGSLAALFFSFVHNAQSSGSVTLKSANPSDHPVIDSAFLSHPYDRQVIIHAVRDAMKICTSTKLGDTFEKYIFAPKSDSDYDILAFARDVCMPEFHANGTAKMGPPEDPMACVDTGFRVYGVRGLRIVDLSVCPITPNAHTQGVAYVVAETAAEKLIQEYKL